MNSGCYPSSKWWLRNFFFFYPPHLTEIQEFFLLKGCSCGIVSCIYHELSTWKEIGAGQPVRQKESHQGQAWDSSEPTILRSSWPAVSEEDVASTVSCKQRHLGNHLRSCGPPCPHLISVVDTVCWKPRSSCVLFILQHTGFGFGSQHTTERLLAKGTGNFLF